MTLLFDTARCLGIDCDRRERCERYRQMENAGPRTPYYSHLCDAGEHIIEHKPAENKA